MLLRTLLLLSVAVTLIQLAGCAADVPEQEGGIEPPPEVPLHTYSTDFDARRALAVKGYWEAVPDTGVELGFGWDSREGRLLPNRCANLSPVRSPDQSTLMSLNEVTSRSDGCRELCSIAASPPSCAARAHVIRLIGIA